MPYFSNVSIFSRTSEEWSELLYDDREMCSIPAPFYYSIGLTGAHLFSIPIYFAAFYALSREKSSNFIAYKPFLAFHAVSNFLFEFYLSLAMKPVLYLPNRITRFAGVSIIRYFNGGIIFFLFFGICIMTCLSIAEMVNYRFKTVAEINISQNWVRCSVKVLKYWRQSLYIFVCGVIVSLMMCIGGLFDQVQLKHNMGAEFIEKYPELMCSSAIIIPIGTAQELKPIHVFNLFTFITLNSGSMMCCYMGLVSICSLNKLITKCSQKTIQMHRMLLYSLFVQVFVHGMMLGFPIVFYVIAMIFKFDGNDIGYIAIITASLHGAMSTLSMILFNRKLYTIVVTSLKSMFAPKFVNIRNVSFVSASTPRHNIVNHTLHKIG